MPKIQVDRKHYFVWRYLTRDRWMNYWYQLSTIALARPETVLEIGVGNGLVADTMKKLGIGVTTVDIDPELNPDVLSSITALPLADNSFDLVLAAEVLEHLPWEELPKALSEIRRVTRSQAIITLPYAGYAFAWVWKIPLIPWQRWFFKLPHFWKVHAFDGEHYWEVGKRTYSVFRVARVLEEAGLNIIEKRKYPDDPSHIFFLLKKND